jgi:mannan endo-1,4-beta-mannosidase
MRLRLGPPLALAIAATAVFFTGARYISIPSPAPPAHVQLPAAPSSYLGVYEPGAPPAYRPVAEFAQAAGSQPNLLGYYSGWAERFQMSAAQADRRHGMIPFVQIDPTFASVAGIADGDYDSYLRSYADSVRTFGHGVVIGFGHEMNAPWYSWGYGHVPAATFVAAWRHIVTLFRGAGADNVTWLWTINADEKGTGPVQAWWPGQRYVSWVGVDGFYYRPSDTFARVFGRTIKQVRRFTSRPVLLSETAVGPQAGQFVKISDLFAGITSDHLLGLVWFDVPQHAGRLHQDWRVEDSPAAEAAFKLGIAGLSLVRPAK